MDSLVPSGVADPETINSTFNETNDRVADYVVGCFFIGSSTFFIVIYSAVLFVIFNDKDLMAKSCYKIMASMGVSDVVQLLLVGLVSGSFTLANSTVSCAVNKVIGGLLNSCWLATTVLGSTLALDRFFVIALRQHHPDLFGGRAIYTWIGCCWAYAFIYFVCYMLPDLEVIYFLDEYTWDYAIDKLPSLVCWKVELVNDAINNALMFVLYVAIGVCLKRSRQAASRSKLSSKDKKALLQSLLMCLLIMIYVLIWFGMPVVSTSKWARLTMNVIWILMAGLNGLFYIIFNRTIRAAVGKLLHHLLHCNVRMSILRPRRSFIVVAPMLPSISSKVPFANDVTLRHAGSNDAAVKTSSSAASTDVTLKKVAQHASAPPSRKQIRTYDVVRRAASDKARKRSAVKFSEIHKPDLQVAVAPINNTTVTFSRRVTVTTIAPIELQANNADDI